MNTAAGIFEITERMDGTVELRLEFPPMEMSDKFGAPGSTVNLEFPSMESFSAFAKKK
jgi:hypothetical protein